MILTVTFNPTIDRVLFVRDFEMQDLVRAEREVVSPSGKGIDVSIILTAFRTPTLALSLNAGHSGHVLDAMLDELDVPHKFVAANGETRTAALLMDVAQGRQSTILAPTLTADESHLDRMVDLVAEHAADSWGLVTAGSLPPGLPSDAHARVSNAARQAGLVTLLDSSGDGLRCGVAGQPDILKINDRELAELGIALDQEWPGFMPHFRKGWHKSLRKALADYLLDKLGDWAREAIVITLGRGGALVVTGDGSFHAPALDVPVVSPAGAGDGVGAGLMLARRQGQDWPQSLALGTAMAAAIVGNEGTAVCTQAEIEALLPQVRVKRIIPDESTVGA